MAHQSSFILPSALTAAAGVAVGWSNLHTDEVTVVLAIEIVVCGAVGIVQPRHAWANGLLVGACVPASAWLARLAGWHMPYPNTLANIGVSFIAVPPAIAAAELCGFLRRAASSRPLDIEAGRAP